MSQDSEESQKTEQPTQHRLQEAARKGQIVFSREVMNFIIFFTFALLLFWHFKESVRDLGNGIGRTIKYAHTYQVSISSMFPNVNPGEAYKAALIPMLVTFVALLIGGFAQTRFNFSGEPIKFNLERISPLKGFNRLFSSRSLVEFLKSLVKMAICGIACYMAVSPHMSRIESLPMMSLMDAAELSFYLTGRATIAVCLVMFVLALLDYFYQRYAFLKSLRMTREEVKEEYRQMEGDPHIKGKLKQIRMQRARKRMMANVPHADVVITNPTHYAVALKYESESMRAPKLVAKGVDLIALKIKEIAEKAEVPIVSNPLLARALYDQVDLDGEIPADHYKAVAEVIGFVYRLKGKTR